MTPNPPPLPVQEYPGGQDAVAYRWTFALWLVLFLGVICLSLLNYFGLMLHRRMG